MKIAVFDIGTNSIHLVVYRVKSDHSYKEIEHEKDVTRLGDGSFETGRLSKEAIRRAVETIHEFHKIARRRGAKKTLAVATSAVREAKNQSQFLRAVRRRTGLRVNVISGLEEARLIFLAASSSIGKGKRNILAVDVGGGSVELMAGRKGRTEYLESFPLGVARLTDHFIRHDPPHKNELKRLELFIGRTVSNAASRIRKIGYSRMVGTAGTMMALTAAAYYQKRKKPIRYASFYELKKDELSQFYQRVASVTLRERLKFPELDPRRADIIVAGGLLVLKLMEIFRVRKLAVCRRGIREGLVLDFIEKMKERG